MKILFDLKSYFRKIYREHSIKVEFFIHILIFIFAILLIPELVRYYLEATSVHKINFSFVFLAYLVTLVFFFVFSSKALALLKHSANILVVFGVLIPVVLFVLQFSVETSRSSLSAENAIKQANQNTETFSSFALNNIEKTPEKYFWKDFDVRPYIENWPYLSENYSAECKTAYIKLTDAMMQFNSINQQRKSLDIERIQVDNDLQVDRFVGLGEEYAKEQSLLLRYAKSLVSFVVGNCQEFKQRH